MEFIVLGTGTQSKVARDKIKVFCQMKRFINDDFHTTYPHYTK